MSDSIFLTDGNGTITDLTDYGKTLSEITIPAQIGDETITAIGDYAFYCCTGLTSVTIPNSVTSIGGAAFKECTGLTSITIPSSVTSIGDLAFDECMGLTSVTISEGVTNIGSNAFAYCTRLTSVTIPSSVTSIGSYAFAYCTRLTSIEFEHVSTDSLTINSGAFYRSSNLATTVIVPDISNIHTAISGYDWTGSMREVTYQKGIPSEFKKDFLIYGGTLYNTAEAVRTLTGTTTPMTPVEMASTLDTHNTEMTQTLATQDDLIAQIAAALEGKTAGGGIDEPQTCSVELWCSGNGSYTTSEGANSTVNYSASVYRDGEIQFIFGETGNQALFVNDIIVGSIVTLYTSHGGSYYASGNAEILTDKSVTSPIGRDYSQLARITGDASFGLSYCYIRGTKILLANGSFKEVQDITYTDDLLVWDFDNGCYASAKPIWIKKAEKTNQYYHCVFNNQTALDLVGGRGHAHRVFCQDTNKFEYANDCVGKMVMTYNGPAKMVSCELVEETVDYYNIITDYHMNLYANGILTSTGFNNLYPIENMKFVKDDRELIPYETFADCPEKYYYGLRLGEQMEYTIERINEKIANIQEAAIENWN